MQQSPNIEVEPPSPKTHSPRRPTPHNKKLHHLVKASQKLSTHDEAEEAEEEHSDDEQFDQPPKLNDNEKASLVTLWMDGSGSGSESGGWLEGV